MAWQNGTRAARQSPKWDKASGASKCKKRRADCTFAQGPGHRPKSPSTWAFGWALCRTMAARAPLGRRCGGFLEHAGGHAAQTRPTDARAGPPDLLRPPPLGRRRARREDGVRRVGGHEVQGHVGVLRGR